MPSPLPPFPRPLGLFTPLMAQQSETLVMKEKVMSLSGNSFDVCLANASKQPVLHVAGEALSLSKRMNVSDAQGRFLFCVRKRHLQLHATFYAEDGEGREVFACRSRFKLGGSKFIGTFVSPASGKQETLVMKGDWTDTSASIVDEASGQAVATIYRNRWNLREMLGGQQTYEVAVAPNVDMAIIAAMCICLDMKRNESK
ncbi:DUF567-domain-containing protein [Whalleya microplaca]|nr:DUF567-domain-containing protein [Whalleya microplaca]